jgi:hypothetical protein
MTLNGPKRRTATEACNAPLTSFASTASSSTSFLRKMLEEVLLAKGNNLKKCWKAVT